ncbi:MAG: hypothetical protein LBF59_08560, partial [Prevotellaceae bacterium]|nr:hypothetical protein [Prevotellaceae bacterium]
YWDIIRTEQSVLEMAETENLAKGLAKGLEKGRAEGLAKGIEKGRAEGRVEGLAEGIEKGKRETVITGYKNGFSIEQIQAFSNLDREQIEEILNSINED